LFPNLKDSLNPHPHRVLSPTPTSYLIETDKTIPNISYLQTDECSSYASSYDSRGDHIDGTKSSIINSETNTHTNNRESISSQITLVNENDEKTLYENRLSPISNQDESYLSTTSTSPTDQSTRSKCFVTHFCFCYFLLELKFLTYFT